jgi:hypothetical protein
VFAVPATTEFPVMRPQHTVTATGTQLVVAVTLEDPLMRAFEAAGGFLLLDLVCDILLDGGNVPVASSLAALTGGSGVAVPGGLMRLTVQVVPG